MLVALGRYNMSGKAENVTIAGKRERLKKKGQKNLNMLCSGKEVQQNDQKYKDHIK